MASQSDLYLLGIGYRHVKTGGADEFAGAGKKIKQSGKEAADAVSALEAATGSAAAQFAAALTPANAVKAVLGALAAAAAAAGFAIHKALEEFAAFEQAMKNVKAVSGSTEAQLASLSDAALDLSRNSRFDPKQVAEGLYALASAGLDASKQLQALPGNMAYAEAAQTSLGQATETTLLALNNFNLSADQTTRVADVFTAAIGKSAFNADRLSVALRNAAPAAGTMNQSFEGTMAVLSVLVKRFNNGELAGTGFKVALAQLQEKAKDLGIQVRDAHGNMLPMADILDVLEKRGIHAKDSVHLFGQEAGPALAVLMQTGSKALREMEKGLASNGQAARTAKDQLDTLEGSQKVLANSIEVFWIKLGRALSGGQRDLTQELLTLVQRATAWVVDHAVQIGHAWETGVAIASRALEMLLKVVFFVIDHLADLRDVVALLAVAWAAWKIGAAVTALGLFVGEATLAEVAGYALIVVTEGLAAAWSSFAAAVEASTVALLANPVGLILVAVAAAALAVVAYTNVTRASNEEVRRQVQVTQDARGEINLLTTATRRLTDAERERVAQQIISATTERNLAEQQLRDLQKKAAGPGEDIGGLTPWNIGVDPQEIEDAQGRVRAAKQTLDMLWDSVNIYTRANKAAEMGTADLANATGDLGGAFEKLDGHLEKNLAAAELAAQRAEALYRAQQQGLPVVLSTTRAFDLQDAALAGIEAKNEAAARALAAFAARLFDAKRNLDLLVDAQQRDTETSQKLATARAAVTDAVAGNNRASQAAARAAEVEAFRQKFLLALDDDRVKKLRVHLELRDRELRLSAQEAAAAQREIEFNTARRTAEAALEDARNQNAEASRGLAIQLEIENRIKAEPDGSADKIAAEVIGRHAVTAALADQALGVKALQQAQSEAEHLQARFADSQQVRAATKALGSEIAGILEKYGLLSDATKELEIHEKALAIAAEEQGTRSVAAIEAVLRARQRELDAKARDAAATEIAQSKEDKLLSSVVATFSQLSEAMGGASTSIGRITGAIGGVVSALGTLRNAGKAWSVDWTNAMVGAIASVGALLKELNIGASNKTGGAQALGGRLDSNYAGIGSLLGTIIGGIIGAIPGGIAAGAGAAIGGAIGTVLGSMISKAGDSASATLLNGGNIQINESSRQLNGAVRDALLNIFKGLNAELASMGMMLDALPFIDIKVRDNIVRVIVGSVVRTFSSMNDAISFGIGEALRQSATSGGHLPPEVLAALKNSTATDLEALKSDIAFAQSIANYGVPQVVQSIDKAVSDFFVAMQRAAQLGIDSTKVVAQFRDQIQAQKDALLGIDRTKSPQDRLRDDVAAFNQRMELLKAEKQGDMADLLFKKADLQAKLAIAQAEAQVSRAHIEISRAQLESDAAVATAQLETLVALQSALAAVDVAIATTQAIIDSIVMISDEELNAALARLQRAGGGGGGARAGASLVDQVAEARRAREVSQMSALGQAIDAVNVKWDKAIAEQGLHADALQRATQAHNKAVKAAHGNAEAIERADAAYRRATRNIAAQQEALAAANREREAEIALLREQAAIEMEGRLRDYEKGAPGNGTPEEALAAIQEEAAGVRAEFAKTAVELGLSSDLIASGLARISAAERAREKALAESVIGGLGLPMEQARARARALGDAVSFLRSEAARGVISIDRLNDALAQAGQQAQVELLGMAADLLDQMGRFDEADGLRRDIDEVNFHLQRAQLSMLFQAAVAAGVIFGDLQAKIQGILNDINNPANWPDFTLPAPQRQSASGGGADASSAVNDDANRRKAILDQISEWNRLGESDATAGLRDLHDTLVSMQADARRLGVSLSDLMAANAHAIEDFWNRTLAPYEESANVIDRLAEINRDFDAMIAAAQQYGGDQARIEADRLRAVEAFWNEALQPIRDLQQQFQQGSLGGGMTPEQRLAAAQQRFNDLAARAMTGDAAAIQALPDAVQAILDQQRAFSGTGPAYQALVATIQGVLDQILALGGAVTPAAAAGDFPGLPPALAPAQPGAPPAPRPVPVPAGATGAPHAQIPIYADHVDRLVGAIEEDVQSQRDDRASVQQLRAQVDRLVSVTREQSQQISDLVATTKRLTALAESNERRNATGGARRVS